MSDFVSIAIKPATGGEVARFTVQVPKTATILELKEEVAKHGPLSALDQRLIYKGQVMKDERTVDDYGIQNEHVVHMVRGRRVGDESVSSPAQAPTARGSLPTDGTGMGGLGGLSTLMDRYGMQSLLGADSPLSGLLNPEMLRTIMMSNPQMQQIIESNPQMAQLLNNPEVMRETMQLMQNPNLMREHMRNTDVAMRNIEGMPEGFNHLRRMYETMEPMMQDAGGNAMANPLAALLGGLNGSAPAPTGAAAADQATDAGPNSAPLPNPWSPTPPTAGATRAPANPFGMAGLPGLGGMPAGIDPNALTEMMQQPEMQNVMQRMLGNPDIMQMMLNVDPNMQRIVDTVPGMREMFADPNMLRAMFNPQVIQAATQASMQAGGLSGAPGGALGAQPDMAGLMGMLGSMGALGGAIPPVSNPEEAYRSQLQQLADMGFIDREANIRALSATQGNVNAAVERLLGGM